MEHPERVAKVIGRQIQQLRQHQAEPWTQTDLAQRVGIQEVVLAAIERGEKTPSPELLISLAQALGVRASDLLDGETVARVRPVVDFSLENGLSAADIQQLLNVAHWVFPSK